MIRLEQQAENSALLKQGITLERKNALHWQQRAIDLGFKCEKLETRLAGAEYLLQGVLLGEDVRSQVADWVNVPFFEEQKAKVSANGG